MKQLTINELAHISGGTNIYISNDLYQSQHDEAKHEGQTFGFAGAVLTAAITLSQGASLKTTFLSTIAAGSLSFQYAYFNSDIWNLGR